MVLTPRSSELPVDIELSLTGLDLTSRHALHASIAVNTRRAFARLGTPVERVRVLVNRVPRGDLGERWEVAVGVILAGGRVDRRSEASRPHLALEAALLGAWSECAALLGGLDRGAARAVA